MHRTKHSNNCWQAHVRQGWSSLERQARQSPATPEDEEKVWIQEHAEDPCEETGPKNKRKKRVMRKTAKKQKNSACFLFPFLAHLEWTRFADGRNIIGLNTGDQFSCFDHSAFGMNKRQGSSNVAHERKDHFHNFALDKGRSCSNMGAVRNQVLDNLSVGWRENLCRIAPGSQSRCCFLSIVNFHPDGGLLLR
jgi:hypothetical protein